MRRRSGNGGNSRGQRQRRCCQPRLSSIATRKSAAPSISSSVAALLAWFIVEFIFNARANLDAQKIASGFGFLDNTAGFGINQTLISYSETDTYGRVFLVGLLNTLLVAGIGVVLATILGFAIGDRAALAELAAGAACRRLCRGDPQPAAAVPDPVLVPRGARHAAGTAPELFAVRRGLHQQSRHHRARPDCGRGDALCGAGPARGLARCDRAALLGQAPAGDGRGAAVAESRADRRLAARGVLRCRIADRRSRRRVLHGFNFVGGIRLIPEFVALLFALTTYTAAFIAEIVRAGILAVPRGQTEAALALGLRRGLIAAAGGRAAGAASHRAAADQPVSQPDQELVAGGRDRLSGPGRGLRRHHAQPDRPGDRDHRHHDGGLSGHLARHQRR